ncbi:MAG: InlB B-repeat-containing protein [Eubacteriaceae bacterium]|nr:InlB B-repeat-containing protein [Eubacteriaceae bacterium]
MNRLIKTTLVLVLVFFLARGFPLLFATTSEYDLDLSNDDGIYQAQVFLGEEEATTQEMIQEAIDQFIFEDSSYAYVVDYGDEYDDGYDYSDGYEDEGNGYSNAGLQVVDLRKVYDGSPLLPMDGIWLPNGCSLAFSLDGALFSTDQPSITNAGELELYVMAICEGEDPVVKRQRLVVTPRNLSIAPENAEIGWDGASSSVAYLKAVVVSGDLVDGHVLQGRYVAWFDSYGDCRDLSFDAGGPYMLDGAGSDVSPNYRITVNSESGIINRGEKGAAQDRETGRRDENERRRKNIRRGYEAQDPAKVEKIALSVQAPSKTVAYDGSKHTLSGFEIKIELDIEVIELVWDYELALVDVGTISTRDVGSPKVFVDGIDSTEMFDIDIAHGELTVLARPITISFGKETKVYSGGFQVFNIEGSLEEELVEGHSADAWASLRIKDAGSYSSRSAVFDIAIYDSKGIDIARNYDISTVVDVEIAKTPVLVYVTPDPVFKLYGDRDPSLTATVNGALGEDAENIIAHFARESGESVGTYAITGFAPSKGGANSNYESIIVERSTFTILPVIRYEYTGEVPSKAPSLPASKGAQAGKSYEVATNPSVSGYKFSGWASKEAAVDKGGAFIMPDNVEEVLFTGKFTKIEAAAPVYPPQSSEHPDKETQDEETPGRDEYFEGAYQITYWVGSALHAVEFYKGGDVIVPMLDPEIGGSEFIGWSGLPDIMPDNDLSVDAVFTKEVVTLYYYLDGELFASQKYMPGESIVPVDSPMIKDKKFDGWDLLPAFMPGEDVSVNGTTSFERPTVVLRTKWALANLVLALSSVLLSSTLLVGFFSRRDIKHKALTRISSIFPALLGMAIFFTTEDVKLPMALTDVWTPVMVLINFVTILIAMKSRREDKQKLLHDILIDEDEFEDDMYSL